VALAHRIGAENLAGQLRPAGTHQPGQRDDLTGMDDQFRVIGRSARQAAYPQHDLAGLNLALGVLRGDIAPDHQPHQTVTGDVGHRVRADHAPIAQYRDPIRQLEDFLKPVRDVDNGYPLIAEPPDHVEQVGNLLLAEGGSRLVHDQQPDAARERLGDLYKLAGGDPQLGNGLSGWKVDAQQVEQFPAALVHGAEVDDAAHGLRLVAQKDVTGHAQVGDQVQFLVDDTDANALHARGSRLGDALVGEDKLAGIGLVCAGEDLDQGGLARAVLADEGMDLTGVDFEVHVVQGKHARKPLGDGAHA